KVLRWIGYTMLGAVTACVISLCLLIVLVPASYLPLFPLIALVYLAIPATPFLLFLLIDSLLSKD
ncbi:MAG TPA: hypothetical protein VLG71_03555, partial [Candidatus Limnocylindria bacterium]|nr:hypothetical protein [Candidatus Limnocylindria bacterium]